MKFPKTAYKWDEEVAPIKKTNLIVSYGVQHDFNTKKYVHFPHSVSTEQQKKKLERKNTRNFRIKTGWTRKRIEIQLGA